MLCFKTGLLETVIVNLKQMTGFLQSRWDPAFWLSLNINLRIILGKCWGKISDWNWHQILQQLKQFLLFIIAFLFSFKIVECNSKKFIRFHLKPYSKQYVIKTVVPYVFVSFIHERKRQITREWLHSSISSLSINILCSNPIKVKLQYIAV